jgi:hypothetical protein
VALVIGAALIALVVVGVAIVATRSGTDRATSFTDPTPTTVEPDTVASSSVGGPSTSDFVTFDDATNGYSIATPPSWKQISLSDPQAQAALDQLIAQNPQLAKAMGDATALAKSGVAFLATDPAGGSTVNVLVSPAAGAPAEPTKSDLEEFRSVLTEQLETAGATVTGHDIVTVNGRHAVQIRYDLPLTTGGADINFHGTAHVFVVENTIYTVTIVGTEDVVDDVISTFTLT